jgi:hypothetical protein
VSPQSPKSRAQSDTGIARKLEEVDQTLDSIATQKDLVEFLNSPENVQKLNDLMADIRDALIDYQVCPPKPLDLLLYLIMPQTSLQQDLYDKSCQMIVSLTSLLPDGL